MTRRLDVMESFFVVRVICQQKSTQFSSCNLFFFFDSIITLPYTLFFLLEKINFVRELKGYSSFKGWTLIQKKLYFSSLKIAHPFVKNSSFIVGKFFHSFCSPSLFQYEWHLRAKSVIHDLQHVLVSLFPHCFYDEHKCLQAREDTALIVINCVSFLQG